jgi:ribosome-binding factor A
VLDESDAAQARVFYDLLSHEAAALTTTIRALTTRRGVLRSTAEAQLFRRELEEVHRCLDQLRNRFPELDRHLR